MQVLQSFARYGTFPLFLIGINGLLIGLVGSAAPWWQCFAVLMAAIGLMCLIERLIPYQTDWNRSHDDIGRDIAHFFVNTTFNHAGVFLLPLLTSWLTFSDQWPRQWPFWLQVVVALLVLDIGISAAHHASHKWNWLWRFHAVHHSAKRLYGFNGLMKHPVHQTIETASGILPLLLLGIPPQVASAVAFCVAIQLLLQHANADYRTGPLKYLFAIAEVHRFHHVNRADEGNVNFGLFTTLWDHLMGTFHYVPHQAPKNSDEVGLATPDDYPSDYLRQLIQPFKRA